MARQKKERDTIQFQKLSDGIFAINYKTKTTKLKYTKEELLGYLEGANESQLREASRYFFLTSGQYLRVLGYFANILTFDHLTLPKVKDEKFFKQNSFDRDFKNILEYLDNSYVEETCRFVSLITLLDGVFYGYERELDGKIALQQLPPNWCRSKYKINGAYAVEFNLRFFDSYRDTELKINVLKSFPEEFTQHYLNYKNGNTSEWVMLNPIYARCHKFDDHPIPLFSRILPDLITLKEYKEFDKTQTQMDLYKLIVQTIPLDKTTGLPVLKLEESQALHKNAKKMISQEGIDVLTTPLEVQGVNLQERGQTIRDNIERANNNVYDATGSSKILFSSGKDGGSIGLSNSIKNDEAVMFPMLDQFRRWYDNRISQFSRSRNYSFKTMFPQISIFNRVEMYDKFKDAATLGYSKFLPYLALGIKQTETIDLLSYENDYLNLTDKMKPLQSSHTTSNASGRPKKPQGELTPSGEKTKNNDANNDAE